jgi:preprotein translocase subunit SecD
MAHTLTSSRFGWIATGIVLTNALCATFAISTLADVRHSNAGLPLAATAEPAQPTTQPKSSQLTWRSQKPGTANQLHQAQQRRQKLVMRQNRLAKTDTQARANLAVAIGEVDQVIANLYEPAHLDSADIAKATVGSRVPTEVTIQFTTAGRQKFAQLTQELAGTDRTLGIFLDQKLIMTPSIEQVDQKISGGKVQLAGNFSRPQAVKLARRFNNSAS